MFVSIISIHQNIEISMFIILVFFIPVSYRTRFCPSIKNHRNPSVLAEYAHRNPMRYTTSCSMNNRRAPVGFQPSGLPLVPHLGQGMPFLASPGNRYSGIHANTAFKEDLEVSGNAARKKRKKRKTVVRDFFIPQTKRFEVSKSIFASNGVVSHVIVQKYRTHSSSNVAFATVCFWSCEGACWWRTKKNTQVSNVGGMLCDALARLPTLNRKR